MDMREPSNKTFFCASANQLKLGYKCTPVKTTFLHVPETHAQKKSTRTRDGNRRNGVADVREVWLVTHPAAPPPLQMSSNRSLLKADFPCYLSYFHNDINKKQLREVNHLNYKVL